MQRSRASTSLRRSLSSNPTPIAPPSLLPPVSTPHPHPYPQSAPPHPAQKQRDSDGDASPQSIFTTFLEPKASLTLTPHPNPNPNPNPKSNPNTNPYPSLNPDPTLTQAPSSPHLPGVQGGNQAGNSISEGVSAGGGHQGSRQRRSQRRRRGGLAEECPVALAAPSALHTAPESHACVRRAALSTSSHTRGEDGDGHVHRALPTVPDPTALDHPQAALRHAARSWIRSCVSPHSRRCSSTPCCASTASRPWRRGSTGSTGSTGRRAKARTSWLLPSERSGAGVCPCVGVVYLASNQAGAGSVQLVRLFAFENAFDCRTGGSRAARPVFPSPRGVTVVTTIAILLSMVATCPSWQRQRSTSL